MTRKALTGLLAVVAGISLAYLGLDFGSNRAGRYLTLSPMDEIDDRIEMHQGAPGFPTDIFHYRGFLYETDYERRDLEPDKRFDEARIADRPDTRRELTGRLRLTERLPIYGRDGLLASGFELAKRVLGSKEKQKDWDHIGEVLTHLPGIRHAGTLEILANVKSGDQDSAPARALIRLGASQSISELVKRLEDEDAYVRGAAVQALVGLDAREAAPEIVKRLEDDNWEVRPAAAQALLRLGYSVSADWLYRLRDDDSTQALALGLLSRIYSGVRRRLHARIEELGRTATESGLDGDALTELSHYQTQAAVDLIVLSIDTETAGLGQALSALGRIGEYRPELVIPVLDDVLDAARSTHKDVRLAAIATLGKLIAFRGERRPEDLPELLPAILRVLCIDECPDQGEVEQFDVAEAKPDDLRTRLAILAALGDSGRPEAAERLLGLAQRYQGSKDPVACDLLYPRILFQLERIGYPPAKELLEERLAALREQKARWRAKRDESQRRAREGRNGDSAANEQDSVKPWKFEMQEYDLAYALARSDPLVSGIALLDDPLYQARRAAVAALAGHGVSKLIVELIEQVLDYPESRLPRPFPFSAYQAIDRGLWVLELTGNFEDHDILWIADDALCADVPEISFAGLPPPSLAQTQSAACDRLDWTITELDYRLIHGI